MRNTLFAFLTRIITRRPGTILLVCAFLTVIMFFTAFRITMKTQISDMMPKGIPMVQEFQDIIKDFESASSIMIAVESKEKDVALMKQCADDIADKLKSIKRIKPAEGQKLSIIQKIALLSGKFPVEGVVYDTSELVKRIDYKADNEFIARHGMMMQKTKDLDNFVSLFGSVRLADIIENINNNFEKEFIDDAENMSTLDGEAQAVQGLQSMHRFVETIGSYIDTRDTAKIRGAVQAFVTGPQYFISSDNTLLMLMLQPTVDMDEFEESMYLGYQVVDSLEAIRADYPSLEIGGTGWMLIQIDEMEASKKDFGWPSLIALVLILLLLVSSFRTWKNPFYSVFTLLIAIIWTAGLLAIVLQYLNMMSAAFGMILIGLGIDFGIHFISGFRDGQEQGLSVADSIAYMYSRVGSGVVTGALTTAIVFFSLLLTQFKAFSEMGIAIGSGIIVTLLAAMILLPALIVWDNKGYSVTASILRKTGLGWMTTGWIRGGAKIASFFNNGFFNKLSALMQFRFLVASGKALGKLPVAVVVVLLGAITIALSLKAARTIEFEYNMMELEPVGIPTGIVQDKILEKFEIAPDYAMFRVKDVEECRSKITELKKVGDRTGVIGGIDGISEFIPTKENQNANIPRIESFRNKMASMPVPENFTLEDSEKLHDELLRLHQNIVEIGELSIMGSGVHNKIIKKCDQIVGKEDAQSTILALRDKIAENVSHNPHLLAPYQRLLGSVLKQSLLQMSSTTPITLETLPDNIRNRYVSPSSKELIVTVFPRSNIWEERILRRFTEETAAVSPRITGMPPMTLLLIDLMKDKGRKAIIMGTIAIIIFLLFDFRSFKYTLFALIPLGAGTVWMLGLMALFDIKFSIMNFMCLPLILGIGIDDGVHILHRYKKEGPGSTPTVLKYTGRAILLTSLTTMIGFGSMGLATHRGVASMGQVLFLGVGACFISSAYLLPAIITIWEKIFGKHTEPVALSKVNN